MNVDTIGDLLSIVPLSKDIFKSTQDVGRVVPDNFVFILFQKNSWWSLPLSSEPFPIVFSYVTHGYQLLTVPSFCSLVV